MPKLTTEEVIFAYRAIMRSDPSSTQIYIFVQDFSLDVMHSVLIDAVHVNVFPVMQLYQAVYGRVPDSDGLDFWVGNFVESRNGGTMTLDDLSEAFSQSQEFFNQYDNLTPLLTVQKMYENVLGRGAEVEGLLFWSEALTKWTADLGQEAAMAKLVLAFSQSGEFTVKADPYIKGFLQAAADGVPVYNGSLLNPDFLEETGMEINEPPAIPTGLELSQVADMSYGLPDAELQGVVDGADGHWL